MTVARCPTCDRPIVINASESMRAAGYVCTCGPEVAKQGRPGGNGQITRSSGLVARTHAETIEDMLADQLTAAQVEFQREYRFAPPRKWRADFFIRPNWLIEVEGILYQGGGRHQTYSGMENDAEKYNAAILMGFRLLRVTGRMVRDGRAFALIHDAIKEKLKWARR